MAHKKGVGSTDNGRDSNPKYLGVKLYGGQLAKAGNIIIRQRGTKFHAGENTYLGKDFTLHAKVDGYVSFRKRRFNRTFVDIIPLEPVAETVAKVAPPKTKKKATPKKEATIKATPVAAPASEPVEKAPVEKAAPVAKNKKETAPAKKAKPKKAKKIKQDDLKIIEGIGPKIESLLKEGGLETWAKVATATPEQIREILLAAGPRYKMHNPTTWPQQAKLADEGKFDELKAWQDELDGGK